ncbi:hypothetical protein AMECASPLE_036602 [Ameca splendens]|uniref:Uncharacterized protein n=1 Tax=Ameca splendens TaxID=208324 RepID=A0ABV0Z6B9_9TELE
MEASISTSEDPADVSSAVPEDPADISRLLATTLSTPDTRLSHQILADTYITGLVDPADASTLVLEGPPDTSTPVLEAPPFPQLRLQIFQQHFCGPSQSPRACPSPASVHKSMVLTASEPAPCHLSAS